MKKMIIAGLIAAGATGAFAETVFSQDREVFVHEANYDKSKIPPYTLEDPLTFVDGRKVKNAADWAERRKETISSCFLLSCNFCNRYLIFPHISYII